MTLLIGYDYFIESEEIEVNRIHKIRRNLKAVSGRVFINSIVKKLNMSRNTVKEYMGMTQQEEVEEEVIILEVTAKEVRFSEKKVLGI